MRDHGIYSGKPETDTRYDTKTFGSHRSPVSGRVRVERVGDRPSDSEALDRGGGATARLCSFSVTRQTTKPIQAM